MILTKASCVYILSLDKFTPYVYNNPNKTFYIKILETIKYTNDIHKAMTQKYTIIIEQGQDGYLISDVVELPGCHTQAKTHDELLKRTKEAISLYIKLKPHEHKSKFIGLQYLEV